MRNYPDWRKNNLPDKPGAAPHHQGRQVKLRQSGELLTGRLLDIQDPCCLLCAERKVTWAADSLAEVGRDIMRNEMVKHSVAALLMAQEGGLTLPLETRARFAYSRWPDVVIPLSAELTRADAPRLTAMLNGKHEYYRKAAKKALDKLQ